MAWIMACAIASPGADKKEKPASAQLVDSGTFAVFVKGQHVLTETFSVEQENGISVVKAQLQETSNPSAAAQTSELRMTSAGELVRYDWSDKNSSLLVVPNNEFLLEKITTGGSSKPAEQPFLMPKTSAILDNNFFVHREALAWRYLASACTVDGGLKCKPSEEYGVLVPQDRSSLRVRLELVGREKVNIRGNERDLLRLNLKGDAFSWALWLDDSDHFKLIRVLIPDDSTEVIRE